LLANIELIRFRGFSRLRADLQPHAFIVGPNSAGKSTILEALALADRCLGIAVRKAPTGRASHRGYSVSTYLLPQNPDFDEDPIRFDFGTEETRVTVGWDNGSSIHLVWPEEQTEVDKPYFFLTSGDAVQPRTLAKVRELYSRITAIPVVTPLERVEELKNPAYVEGKSATRLASRHFRNHAWQMVLNGQWDEFTAYCREWLPEISLLDVQLNAGANRLAVYYTEPGSRIPKELAWAGDGIQIWVQLLWHLFRARTSPTVMLDEPEVYLHPDLQRRLVRLLDEMSSQVMLASHSADVIAEAPPGAVLWVDRKQNSARRANTHQSLSNLGASLGSTYDLALARSMRSRLVLASDASDLRILRVLAKQVGAVAVANEQQVSMVPLRDVEIWSGARGLGSSIREALGVKLPVFVLLQGGFRQKEANARLAEHLHAPNISFAVLNRNELENYLLDPETIARVAGATPEVIASRMADICEDLRESTRSAFVTASVSAARSGFHSQALIEGEKRFDEAWLLPTRRLELVRGTEILDALNAWLEKDGYRTVGGHSLAKATRVHSMPAELFHLLFKVDGLLTSE